MKFHRPLLLAFSALFVLASCGQTGPLYLPEQTQDNKSQTPTQDNGANNAQPTHTNFSADSDAVKKG